MDLPVMPRGREFHNIEAANIAAIRRSGEAKSFN